MVCDFSALRAPLPNFSRQARFDSAPCQLTALEAGLVPFVAAGYAFLSGVDGLLALGAFGVFDRLERHLDLVDLKKCQGLVGFRVRVRCPNRV